MGTRLFFETFLLLRIAEERSGVSLDLLIYLCEIKGHKVDGAKDGFL